MAPGAPWSTRTTRTTTSGPSGPEFCMSHMFFEKYAMTSCYNKRSKVLVISIVFYHYMMLLAILIKLLIFVYKDKKFCQIFKNIRVENGKFSY